jgi:hypothetical protein
VSTLHTAWMIFSGRVPLPFTCQSRRRDCVSHFLDFHCGPAASWKTVQCQGYSVRKITFYAAATPRTTEGAEKGGQ